MDYSLKEHFDHYDEDASKYMGDVLRIFTDRILSKTSGLTVKSHILTVLIQKKDNDRIKKLHPYIDLPEMVRACEILDSSRLIKQIASKLIANPQSIKLKRKLMQAEELIKNQNVTDLNLSLNHSKIKIVKEWVNNIPREKIEYRAMLFDTSLWKKLADLTHLNPKTDFAEGCDWFLYYCFGAPIPEGNVVYDYKTLTYTNFHELYDKHHFSYELIRNKLQLNPVSTSNTFSSNWYSSYHKNKYNKGKQNKRNKQNIQNKQNKHNKYHNQTEQNKNQQYESNKHLIRDIKIKIVNNETINTVVWYWDELVDTYNVMDVLSRLKSEKHNINLSYGKIVDLISKTTTPEVLNELILLGEEKLQNYKIDVESPVAVFGDQSGSMEIAIKTSGIITSLLCYICNAHLHLFHSENEHITNPPKSIIEAVKFGKEVRTKGSTCPAASLMYYYAKKEIVKTIIIITDEEENESINEYNINEYNSNNISFNPMMPMTNPYNGNFITYNTKLHNNRNSFNRYRFADLYKKYITEVYPARLIFISFSDPNIDACMVTSLKRVVGDNVVDELVKVFKFNVNDPDLNRMDIVLKYLEGINSD